MKMSIIITSVTAGDHQYFCLRITDELDVVFGKDMVFLNNTL